MIEQHGSLAEKFIKKGFWLYLFSFIIGPIGYIIKIIISWDLSVSEVWVLYGIMSLIILISAYNDLWLTDSINYFVPKFITEKRYDKVKTILVYTMIAQLITGWSIWLFFFFGADFISLHYFDSIQAKDALKIFAFFFLGINIFQVCSTFFLAVQNTFLYKIVDFVRIGFVLLSALFIFLSEQWSLTQYSYTWVVGLYIGIIFSLSIFFWKYYIPYLKNEKVIWSKELFFNIFKYSLSIFLWLQASVILSQIDMQMILLLLWTKEAWYYTNYLSIITIPFIVIWPIFWFLFPLFSELKSKWDIQKILQIKSFFQKSFLSLAFAFSVFFFVFAKELSYILFGTKFQPSGEILQYSIAFLCFSFLIQMNFNIMSALWKIKERVTIVSIAIVLNIFMNFICIKLMGVNGAALATGIGWVFIWIWSEFFLWKDYKIPFQTLYILKNIVSLLLAGIWLFILKWYFIWLGRWESFILIALYGIIFFWFFFLINISEYISFFKDFKKLRNRW